MNERMQRILADLKARQEAGEHMACPRCGCDTMKPAIYTNALSRQADIMVCDDCGMSEAKLAFIAILFKSIRMVETELKESQ